MNNTYVENSIPIVCDPSFESYYWGLLAFSIFVFFHSLWMYREKVTTLNILTSVSSFSIICFCTCILICTKNTCSPIAIVVVNDFLIEVIFTGIPAIIDNYVTYLRYEVVVRRTNIFFRVGVGIYIFTLLFLTYFFPYTLFPIWFDQNSPAWVLAN